jgi:plastocyanin
MVPVGGKVIWKNDDPFKPHGIVAVDVQGGKYFGGMSTVTIPYGKTLEVTFDTVGTFDYQTVFQPSTEGKIIVTK